MGKSDYREVLSRLQVLISHLLKWIFQKEYRTRSWENTIKEQRNVLINNFKENINYKNHAKENFNETYYKARKSASKETKLSLKTFPEEPPFSLEQILDNNYLPD